ncbi:MAG: CPBP family intramembrane metalloprotease [Spirochaetaceae bacterium]|nr:MAG: CPBP family intramembrane metalloprotease [Spirochaetaceae bacterium]
MQNQDTATFSGSAGSPGKRQDTVLIAVFVVVALVSGWIGVLVDRILPEQVGEESLGMGLWLVLPFLCGVIIRALRRDWADFGLRPRLRGNMLWYALSILIFPAVTLVFVIIGQLFGVVSFSPGSISSIVSVFGALFIGLIIKNVFEDFAWQGFLMPKLVSVKAGDVWIYLIVGLVWAFWHAPYYLYFLPDTYYSTPFGRLLDVFVRSPIVITIWAVVFVEMTRITRSVWPAVLMHTIEDAVPNVLIFDEGIITFHGAGDILLNPLSGVLPLAVFLAFGLWLRTKRIERDARIGLNTT